MAYICESMCGTTFMVHRDKDKILRGTSLSPKGNLLYNGDICNYSSSMDDDSSLQLSPKTASTKDQSIQTEFDIFLDQDREDGEVRVCHFDQRNYCGAR